MVNSFSYKFFTMFPNIIFLFLMQIYNYYCSYTTISIVNFKKNYNSFLFLINYLYLYKKDCRPLCEVSNLN